MIKVGLTGGIGVGKSYVARVFRQMGIPVYDADSNAKELMNSAPALQRDIKQLLGDKAYNEHGLDRRYVAEKVFNNIQLLNKLNEIVHPAVYEDFERWAIEQKCDVVIKESALLLQGGDKKGLDKIILVDADLDVRLIRVQKRDSFRGVEEIKAIIEKQGDLTLYTDLIDYIISNNENEMLVPQIALIKEVLEG